MARRCICSRLLAHLNEDPRLRTLPLAPRMLWLLLAEAMARPGFDGALPFSDTRRVSLLVSAEVSDVEAHLATLLAEGLLAREGDALVAPMLREVTVRVSAARRNGLAGGRPRKGETPEQAQARRRQGELLMPVAETQETQRWETASAGLTRTTTTSSASESESKPVAREETWKELGGEVVRLAGLDPSRMDRRPVRDWLERGATPALILQVVRDVVARDSYSAEKVSSLNYLGKAVMRAMEAPQAAPSIVIHRDGPSAYEMQIQAWKESGYAGSPPVRQAVAA